MADGVEHSGNGLIDHFSQTSGPMCFCRTSSSSICGGRRPASIDAEYRFLRRWRVEGRFRQGAQGFVVRPSATHSSLSDLLSKFG